MKKLSKEEMKKVMGGLSEAGTGCHQCCWDKNPTSCSECVMSTDSGPCVAGAHLQSCPSPCKYQSI